MRQLLSRAARQSIAAWSVMFVGGLWAATASQSVTVRATQAPVVRPGAVGDTQPQTRATSRTSIVGRVLAADGRPLRQAEVRITESGGSRERVTTSEADGRFSFTSVAAGRYRVEANKEGYVRLAYGQRNHDEPARWVDVAEGDTLSGVDIVLPRASAIEGSVVDEYGEPVLRAFVQVLRYQYDADGQRRLVPAGRTDTTDDLGRFRLYGLNPGTYVVGATRPVLSTAPDLGRGMVGPELSHLSVEGYAPTYFPGTANPGEAEAIRLVTGQDYSLQLQLQDSRTVSVSGMIVDSQGRQLAPGAPVRLRYVANGSGVADRLAATGDSGAFSIASVPIGEYIIEVRSAPVRNRTVTATPEFARFPLTVNDTVSGLLISTVKAAAISGTVVVEGERPSNTKAIRVRAESPDSVPRLPAPLAPSSASSVDAQGRFTLTGVMAPSFLRATVDGAGAAAADDPGYVTKAVMVGGVDLVDSLVDPFARGDLSNITIIITSRLGTVTGTVVGERRTRGEPSIVLIVPERFGVLPPARLVRQSTSDDEGRFMLRGVPPGRYAAVAMPALGQDQQNDPSFLRRVLEIGARVLVSPNQESYVHLTLVPDL